VAFSTALVILCVLIHSREDPDLVYLHGRHSDLAEFGNVEPTIVMGLQTPMEEVETVDVYVCEHGTRGHGKTGPPEGDPDTRPANQPGMLCDYDNQSMYGCQVVRTFISRACVRSGLRGIGLLHAV